MSKESTSLSPDWVRCKSKSRANKYFMFNKKTGETTWCPESAASSSQTRKTISAKDIKTPAQDRLKRLQNNLQKKKLDEALAEIGRNSKKAEKTSTVAKRLEDEKNKPSTSKVQDRLKLVEDKPIAVANCKQKTKVSQKRKSDSSETTNETPQKIIRSPRGGGDSVAPKSVTFVIPKKLPSMPSSSSSQKPQFSGDGCSESRVVHFADTSQELDEPSSSTDRSQTSEESSEFDENDNKKDRKDDQRQTGFLSKLKTFYNKIVSSATSPEKTNVDKEKQSRLSSMSKTSFKPKRPEKKNVLRGILQENDNGKLAMTMENFSSKIRKVSSPIPVPSESANARLQRLRKSLHEQHSYSSPAESETSSLSDIVSDGAIEFSGSFRSPDMESNCEPMDWQPISDCIVTSSPSTIEPVTDSSTASEHYDTVNANLMRLAAQRKQSKPWKPDHYYIVIDTNVFIDYLTFVDELSGMKLCDSRGSLIYIPYCVLQELDKLKTRSSSESVKTRAVRAIKYLNKSFDQQNPRIQAQSASDETNHLITVKSPDDSILNCCLQIKQHVKNLILLTEDVNLQNKATCNGILVSTKSDLISRH